MQSGAVKPDRWVWDGSLLLCILVFSTSVNIIVLDHAGELVPVVADVALSISSLVSYLHATPSAFFLCPPALEKGTTLAKPMLSSTVR